MRFKILGLLVRQVNVDKQAQQKASSRIVMLGSIEVKFISSSAADYSVEVSLNE